MKNVFIELTDTDDVKILFNVLHIVWIDELLSNPNINLTYKDRIILFMEKIRESAFTPLEYMREFKEISTATASRDLRSAVEERILEKTGDKRTAHYKFR